MRRKEKTVNTAKTGDLIIHIVWHVLENLVYVGNDTASIKGQSAQKAYLTRESHPYIQTDVWSRYTKVTL
jgi:hypothetical protein